MEQRSEGEETGECVVENNEQVKKKEKKRFKEENSFEKRKNVSEKIRNKFPGRIPVIVEKVPNSTAPDIEKQKFLVPEDITIAKLIYELRKNIPELRLDDGIYLFINSHLPPTNSSIGELFLKHQDDDGFLYILYHNENAFG